MNLDLNGKNAFVGGSSAGIGRAAAIELSRLGASVVLCGRSEEKLRSVLGLLDASFGQKHAFLTLDFGDEKAVRFAAETLAAERPIHILVNNTGGPPAGPIVAAEAAGFLSAIHNHLIINHLLAKTFLPAMKTAGWGRIVNVISTSVKEPLENLGVSNATRGAVASWAKTWALEVGPFGITVNNVLPGYTTTERLENIVGGMAKKTDKSTDEIASELQKHVPLRRFGAPEEVAAAIAFLCSPAAGYISGINLPVDGGRTRSL